MKYERVSDDLRGPSRKNGMTQALRDGQTIFSTSTNFGGLRTVLKREGFVLRTRVHEVDGVRGVVAWVEKRDEA